MLRDAAVVLYSLTVLTSLTSCSDAGAGGESRSAGEPDRAGGSASVSASLDPEADELLELMTAGVGERGTAEVEIRTTGMLRSRARGAVVYDARGSRLRLTSVVPAIGRTPTQLVVTRRTTYVSAPGLTPPGKFVAVPNDDPRLEQWTGGSATLDPSGSLEAIREGLRDVDEVGRARVDGTPTTRYRLDVDAAASLAAQGRTPPPAMPETVSYDVWLDGQGRMRRLTTEIAGSRVVVEFARWGAPVRIPPPPPGDVVGPR